MTQALWVALGGALGSLARYGVAMATTRIMGLAFPWGTLIVNAAGGLAIGALAARIGPEADGARLFWGAGVLGGFTTFSTFSLETVRLLERDPTAALLYVAASLILSVGGCWLGLMLGRP